MKEQIAICLENGFTARQAIIVACRVYLLVEPKIFITMLDQGFERHVRFFRN